MKIKFFESLEEQEEFHRQEFLKLSGLERLNVAFKLRRRFNAPQEPPTKKIIFREPFVEE